MGFSIQLLYESGLDCSKEIEVCCVTVEVPHVALLVEAPVEVVGEGNEAWRAREVAETAITKTGKARLAAGFVEVVETINACHPCSLEFEVVGTVVATGSTKELSLGPLMLEVREGKGAGDIAAPKPPSVPELRIFPNLSRPGEMPFLKV
ncbi:hypothetical protein Nepgr_029737 [Nepenthes gracilis]|uniref:Uncharacterized protein n=1 Tax=Nepenthes gracilis TaxID=150966 RepID=A0AAD3TEV9_NEPGR|nr:hypothetical protein Nepgr_029737 [Nepenthes gracilis]